MLTRLAFSNEEDTTAGLLDHDIYLIAVLHLELFGSIIVLESFSIENEATLGRGDPLPSAIGVHELL